MATVNEAPTSGKREARGTTPGTGTTHGDPSAGNGTSHTHYTRADADTLRDNIPDELKLLQQWVGLKLVPQKGKKPKKVPINPASGKEAKVNDPQTWDTFHDAVASVSRYRLAGIGFVFTVDDPYTGIDLDGCRDPATGALQPWALDVVQRFDSYTEASFFGTGVHILPKGTLPGGGGQHEHVEMYDHGRYFVMTGEHIGGTPTEIEARQDAIDALYREHFPHKLNGKAKQDKAKQARAKQHNALWRDLDEALPFIPAVEHDTWLHVGMGIHSGDSSDAGLALWVEWSQTCPEKFDLADCQKRWQSFSPDGGITEKSIFALAIEHGWRSTSATVEPDAEVSEDEENAHTTAQERDPGDGEDFTAADVTFTADEPDFNYTDLGNGERLIASHGENLLFCNPWKKWLVWDRSRWRIDHLQQVDNWARATIRQLYEDVNALVERIKNEQDKKKKKALIKQSETLLKHAAWSEQGPRMAAMMKFAQMDVPIMPDWLDNDRWLLNVKNGTLDLRTGELRPHSRKDLLTKIVALDYDPEATCPTWKAFLTSIMAGDKDLVDFLQKALGYSLTGDTREDCLFLLYGTGRNGKTTLLETISAVMGDYATTTPFATFLEKKQDAVQNDIAALQGARFVSAVEPDKGKRLSEALVKQATGKDTMSARFLFQEFFRFKPQFKLWLGANYKPVIRGTDDGIWSRIRLIPFTQKFVGAKDNKSLGDQLQAEAKGILAWMVHGCRAWQAEGLPLPEAIAKATGAYRTEQDDLGAFLKECCELRADLRVKSGLLYNAYVTWSGDKNLTQNAFARLLTDRGIDRENKGGTRWRLGIALLPDWNE